MASSENRLQIDNLKIVLRKRIEEYYSIKDRDEIKAQEICYEIISKLKVLSAMDVENKSKYVKAINDWTEIVGGNSTRNGRAEANYEYKRKNGTDGQKNNKNQDDLIDKMDQSFRQRVLSMITRSNIKTSDIGGMEKEKKELAETIFFAVSEPEKNVQKTFIRNILLYGPPGCGKTTLARAVSNSMNVTFFYADISGLVSRYVGDSERIIHTLYEVAKEMSPSIIFMDEIESLMKNREKNDSNVTSIIQVFLAELDGFSKDNRFVLTIGATNLPWELDNAILSRFQKRMYIGLPDDLTRKQVILNLIEGKGYRLETKIDELLSRTQGFSNRDLEYLCTEAINSMYRRYNEDSLEQFLSGNKTNKKLKVGPITMEDFEKGFKAVNIIPGMYDETKYLEWNRSSN
ncbi:AAA family ATPase [Caldiplasma sukawensis]